MSTENMPTDAEIEASGINRMIDEIELKAGADLAIGVGAESIQDTPQMSDEELIADFLGLVPVSAEMAGMQKTAAIWNDRTRRQVADRAVKVMRKYAWGAAMLERMRNGGYVDEIALVITIWPIAKATITTARGEIMEIKNRAKKDSEGSAEPASA